MSGRQPAPGGAGEAQDAVTEPPPGCAGPSPGAFLPGSPALLGHPRQGGRFCLCVSQPPPRGSGALAGDSLPLRESGNHLLKSGPTSRMEKKTSRRDPGEGWGETAQGRRTLPLAESFLPPPIPKSTLAKNPVRKAMLAERILLLVVFLKVGKTNRLGALSSQTIMDRLTGQLLTTYSFGQVV